MILSISGCIITSIVIAFIAITKYVHHYLTLRTKFSLQNKHILITGATKGIGKSIACLLGLQPLRLTLLARTAKDLEEVKSFILNSSCCAAKIQTFQFDVTDDYLNLSKMFEGIVNNFGPVDVLVNCAGGAICGRFEEIPMDNHRSLLEVNYMGSAKMAHLLLNHRNTVKSFNRPTTIVFLSSIAGKFGFYGFGAYSPTKFALEGLAQVLKMENNHKNVNIIVAYPSDTNTPGYAEELVSKPLITKLISEQADLYEPVEVAIKIINAIENQDSFVCFGVTGYLMNCATAGATPPSSLYLQFLMELFLSGIMRFILLLNICSFYKQIRNLSK